MRNWKRVISVMLVLVMTISLTAIPAMAEEEKTTEKSLVYTCLGDSIAAGYSLPTYVARIDAGLVPVEGSYGKIVADTLKADQYNAYGTAGARSLKTATTVGVILHILGGAVGLCMMALLAYLGAEHLLVPGNLFLYQLIWMIPGLMLTEWTRTI